MVLWKKESTSEDACYIDLLPGNPFDFNAMKFIFGSIQKNEADSIAHRKYGNELFKAENWAEAMTQYNKSIRFAPNGSECLGLGYANRAACFLHMQKYDRCLADIELAKNANYPPHLMHKLDERKATCLKAMKERVDMDDKGTPPQLSYSPNKKFSGMANILQVRSNDEYGKYVVAKRDIDVGKMVMVEDVFAVAINYNCETVCKTCNKHVANFIPCPNCTNAMFCSAKCMESNDLHNKFCGAFYHHWPRDMLIVETILIAAYACPNAESLMKFVESALATRDLDAPECESSAQMKYRLFLKLLALPEDISEVGQQMFDIYKSVLTIPFMAQFFRSDKEKRFLIHLIGQHLRILRTNSFGTFHPNGSEYITRVGLCSSLFNHSCVPNILHLTRGNKMIGYVVRPVKKGEQLFIDYFQGRNNASSGQKSLGFVCKCIKCVPCWKQGDGDRIQMDPDFFILLSIQDEDIKNHKTRAVHKARLENLLAKYGRLPWSQGLELIGNHYGKCYEEELSLEDYRLFND